MQRKIFRVVLSLLSCCVAQAGLEHTILLLQPSDCLSKQACAIISGWDERVLELKAEWGSGKEALVYAPRWSLPTVVKISWGLQHDLPPFQKSGRFVLYTDILKLDLFSGR